MSTYSSKCLICLIKVEPDSKFTSNSDEEESLFPHYQLRTEEDEPLKEANHNGSLSSRTNSILQKQLDVIFLLRNLLQLPNIQLCKYLKVRGDPEGWVVLCGSCEELVKNAKEIFLQLQRISRKYDKAKKKIEKRIKATHWIDEANIEAKKDFILDECRKAVCKRKTALKKVSFFHGDRKAQQLLRKYRQLQYDEADVNGRQVEIVDPEKAPIQISSNLQLQCFDNLERPEIPKSKLQLGSDGPPSDCGAPDDTHSVTSSVSPSPSNSDSEAGSDDNYQSDALSAYESEHDPEDGPRLGSAPERSRSQRKRKSSEVDKVISGGRKRSKVEGKCQTENPDQEKKYECSICRPKTKKYKKTTFSQLLAHIYRVHQVSYKCTQCDHGFQSLDSGPISSHYYFYHKDLKCNIPMDSRAEKVTTPKLPKIPWSCPSPTCSAEYPDEKLRDDHILTNHGNNVELERNFKCDHCPNNYFSEDELNAHILFIHPLHFRKSQFQCDQCLQCFKAEKALRLHRIQSHNLDLYKCQHCEAEYKNEQNLLSHTSLKHGDQEEKAKLMKLTCRFCRRIFADEEKYTLHMEKQHSTENESEEPVTCPQCQRVLKNAHGLSLHLFKMHGIQQEKELKSYPCKVEGCGEIFQKKKELKQHMEIHPKEERPSCSICKKDFNNQRNLDRHDFLIHRIVKPSTENMKFYECSKCEKRFHFERDEKFHSAKCKGKTEGPQECEICQAKCATPKDLRIHKKFKHSINLKAEPEDEEDELPEPQANVPCPFCGRFFHSEERMEEHLKRAHEKKEPPIICSLCPERKLHHQSQLDRHNAKYHDINTEDYKCFLCNKFCESRAERKRHVCGIPDKARYGCDQCGKDYKNRAALKAHIAHVHEKQMNAFCDLCDYRTYKETDLLRHKASKHDIGLKCQVEECSRYFPTVKAMEDHVKKIHLKDERERSFLCTDCGKGFYDELALKNHQLAIHLNKETKPYECELCGKGFATSAYRRLHLKTHARPKKVRKSKKKDTSNTDITSEMNVE